MQHPVTAAQQPPRVCSRRIGGVLQTFEPYFDHESQHGETLDAQVHRKTEHLYHMYVHMHMYMWILLVAYSYS